VIAPVTNVGMVIRLRSTPLPSTETPPGWHSVLCLKMSRNSPCSRAGRFVLSAFQARMSNTGSGSPIR